MRIKWGGGGKEEGREMVAAAAEEGREIQKISSDLPDKNGRKLKGNDNNAQEKNKQRKLEEISTKNPNEERKEEKEEYKQTGQSRGSRYDIERINTFNIQFHKENILKR